MNITNTQESEHISRPQIEHLEKEKHEIKHLGTIRHRAGHTLFSYNRATHEIKQVELVRRAELGFDGRVRHHNRVNIEANCYYAESLNKCNFIKHLKKHEIVND